MGVLRKLYNIVIYTYSLASYIKQFIDLIITGAPKRYILDKTDKGFTNIPLIF